MLLAGASPRVVGQLPTKSRMWLDFPETTCPPPLQSPPPPVQSPPPREGDRHFTVLLGNICCGGAGCIALRCTDMHSTSTELHGYCTGMGKKEME